MDAGADNDSLWGGSGSDSMQGGSGDDTMLGDSSQVTSAGYVSTGSVDTTISMTNSVFGGAGNDSLSGDSGNDSVLAALATTRSMAAMEPTAHRAVTAQTGSMAAVALIR